MVNNFASLSQTLNSQVDNQTTKNCIRCHTPLQIEVDWLCMESHNSKNTSQEHLMEFYKTFNEIKDNKYDGLIVTGAPVEKLKFEDVDYWDELTELSEVWCE